MTDSTPGPRPPNATPVASMGRERFGDAGIRIGASVIDFVIVTAVLIPVALAMDQLFLASVIVQFVFFAIFVAMMVLWGGPPGKLALGLRVTEDDGMTTPPGTRPAFMRALPTLLGVIPVIGGLIALGVAIVSVFLVSNDDERRSVYDRVGRTRVVRIDHLR